MAKKTLLKKLKSKAKEMKVNRAETKAAGKALKKKVRSVAFKEKEKQELRLAKEKEKIRAARKLHAFRTRPTFAQRLEGAGRVAQSLRDTAIKTSAPKKVTGRRRKGRKSTTTIRKRTTTTVKRKFPKRRRTIRRVSSRPDAVPDFINRF